MSGLTCFETYDICGRLVVDLDGEQNRRPFTALSNNGQIKFWSICPLE
jgi:hypothetical protein